MAATGWETRMAKRTEDVVSLLFTSEVNLLTGIGDLALITDLQGAPSAQVAKVGEQEGAGTVGRGIELVSALWAIRVALNVGTLYIVVGFGVTLAALITGGLSLLFYGIQYTQLDRLTQLVPLQDTALMYAVAYTSVVNFVLGLPYRKGPGPYYLWMVQILVSFVGVGIIIGCAFSVPEIQDAYGCYSKRSFMELGALGVCPNSTLAGHSHAICQQKVGATPPSSHCQILPWAGTIGAGVLRFARCGLALGLALYIATVEKNYRRLGQ